MLSVIDSLSKVGMPCIIGAVTGSGVGAVTGSGVGAVTGSSSANTCGNISGNSKLTILFCTIGIKLFIFPNVPLNCAEC